MRVHWGKQGCSQWQITSWDKSSIRELLLFGLLCSTNTMRSCIVKELNVCYFFGFSSDKLFDVDPFYKNDDSNYSGHSSTSLACLVYMSFWKVISASPLSGLLLISFIYLFLFRCLEKKHVLTESIGNYHALKIIIISLSVLIFKACKLLPFFKIT